MLFNVLHSDVKLPIYLKEHPNLNSSKTPLFWLRTLWGKFPCIFCD